MRASFRFLLLALAALLLLAAALLFVEFDSPALGRALLKRVAEESGVRVEAERFRLNLLRGVSLAEVRAEGELPGRRVAARAESLVFRHRLLPLLRRRLEIDRVVVSRPRIEILEAVAKRPRRRRERAEAERIAGAARTASAAPQPAAGDRLALRVGSLEIVDGSLAISAAGDPIAVSGLAASLRDLALDRTAATALEGLATAGTLRAAEVVVGETRATAARGEVRLDGGHLLFTRLRFETPEGRFLVSSLDLDLTRDPYRYELALEGDPLDVNVIAGAGRDSGLGAARFELEARGDGGAGATLAGRGSVRIDAGTLPASPTLAGIDRMLGRPVLVGAAYQPIAVPFTVARGRVWLEPFAIVATTFELELSGSAGLDGSLDLEVEARVPRAGLAIEKVPGAILDALTDERGRVVVPLRVTGSRERPRVRPDLEALLGKGAARKLGELFGGR